MSDFEVTQNIDPYANICRMFVLKTGDDLLRVHSGTDGISLATKAWNNSHYSLDRADCEKLIQELIYAIEFSEQAKKDCAAIWAAKNNLSNRIGEIRKQYKVTP